MKHSVEALVARYLDRRDADPDLTPEAFAREHPSISDALVTGIQGALELEASLAPARDAPETIGPYRVVRVVGRGGMGVVYEVEKDGERYALKVLPHAPMLGPAALERFRREARVLAQLDHPGVVRVYDSGVCDGLPYIVMELIRGRPLSALDAPPSPAEAARIVLSVSRAVAALHERGVVHRDVKPQNVMLRADGGDPVLLDFGLVAASGESTLTVSGALLGTPRYMAPEQALGRSTDERTDVYGLGLVLYELAAGRPARPEATRDTMLRLAASGVVTPLRRAGRRIPSDLGRVIRTAVAREPGRRYRSAAELADDLERFLAGAPVRARPPGPFARAIDATRRDPKRVGVAAALVLALAGLGTIALSGLRDAGRAALESRLDRALSAWLVGAEGFARRELEEAARLDSESPGVVALESVLAGDRPAEDGAGPPGDRAIALRDGLTAIARGDGAHAVRVLAAHARGSPFASAVLAEAQRLAGQRDEARTTILAATSNAPSTLALDTVRARLARDEGPVAAGLEAYRAACARAPAFAPLRAALARELLTAGILDEGVRAAASAARELAHTEPDGQTWLPLLLERAEDGAGVRASLDDLLALRPDDGALWFALANSYDDDHRLRDAEHAYRRTLELESGHTRAGLYLAHLLSGAQMGACERCDAAYAEAPEMRDFTQAVQVLVDVLETNRGRDPELPGRVVQAALDLRKRSADERPVRLILAAIEGVLAAPDTPPSARAHLEDGQRRLRDSLGGE